MKVESTSVEKLIISQIEGLDPISVYLENLGPGAGKIIITCYDKSWTHFWSSMGEGQTLRTFVPSCDVHYLAKKLSPGLPPSLPDHSGFPKAMKKEVLRQRWEGELSKDEARSLYNRIYESFDLNDIDDRNLSFEIFSDDWWHVIPSQPNYEYEYLCRIIDVVREVLKDDQS